jgi:hypothetical protein
MYKIVGVLILDQGEQQTMKTTWTLTEENIKKIIARLEKGGRTVNTDIAWGIFRKYFQNIPIAGEYCGDVCEEYKCMIWNAGAVK